MDPPLVHHLGLRRRLGHQLKPRQQQEQQQGPQISPSSPPSSSSSPGPSNPATKAPHARSRRNHQPDDDRPLSLLSSSSPVLPAPPAKPRPSSTLLDLPAELHLMITSHLNYPDALSLKHTTRYFYHLVDTHVGLKIEWLLERRRLHLECPNEQRCDLGSDLRFCRGSVRLSMQRRREHVECESRPDLGCLVFGTKKCLHRPKLLSRLQRWLRCRLGIQICWELVALFTIVGGWLWLANMLTYLSIAIQSFTSPRV